MRGSKIFRAIVKGMVNVSVGELDHGEGDATRNTKQKLKYPVISRRSEQRAMRMHVHDSYGQGIIQ